MELKSIQNIFYQINKENFKVRNEKSTFIIYSTNLLIFILYYITYKRQYFNLLGIKTTIF